MKTTQIWDMKGSDTMKKTCNVYGWTEDNIKIDPPMLSHVAHHVNNPLSIIMGKANKIGGEDGQKILDAAKRIADYVKWLEKLSCEKSPTCEDRTCSLVVKDRKAG